MLPNKVNTVARKDFKRRETMERIMGLGHSRPLRTNVCLYDKHEYEEVAKSYSFVYFETIKGKIFKKRRTQQLCFPQADWKMKVSSSSNIAEQRLCEVGVCLGRCGDPNLLRLSGLVLTATHNCQLS
jgi:hypothetical protein